MSRSPIGKLLDNVLAAVEKLEVEFEGQVVRGHQAGNVWIRLQSDQSGSIVLETTHERLCLYDFEDLQFALEWLRASPAARIMLTRDQAGEPVDESEDDARIVWAKGKRT